MTQPVNKEELNPSLNEKTKVHTDVLFLATGAHLDSIHVTP